MWNEQWGAEHSIGLIYETAKNSANIDISWFILINVFMSDQSSIIVSLEEVKLLRNKTGRPPVPITFEGAKLGLTHRLNSSVSESLNIPSLCDN